MNNQALNKILHNKGLSFAEVQKRINLGQINAVNEPASRSYWHIVRANTLTRFNAIMSTAFIVILIFGSIKDALFGLVFISNILIGIIQEIRAKWTLDRLSLISAPKTKVIRDSKIIEISSDYVVLDDIIELHAGDQVVADVTVLTSYGLEIDESMVTGESVPIIKKQGDKVLSGSYVVAGKGRLLVTAVGNSSYVHKIAKEARKFKLVNSELQEGVNKILRVVTWIMIPAGLLHFIIQMRVFGSFEDAVPGIVAGIISMVPMGLVLLTSVAFAVSIITLGRKKVLVQELPAVEVLARVDTVCFDKTGTLTYGKLNFKELIRLDHCSNDDFTFLLGAFCQNSSATNSTLQAISEAFSPPVKKWQSIGGVPFSSNRKWSAVNFKDKGNWVLGAPEILLNKIENNKSLNDKAKKIANSGLRVLLLAKAEIPIKTESLPDKLLPKLLIVLDEKIKEDAARTLKYFRNQGVNIKILSGDNPNTVATVIREAGMEEIGKPVNAEILAKADKSLDSIIENTTVFGRIKPEQKRSIIENLQSKGHVVAMIGDGVNDVLALKKADIGIAIGSASAATKSVAQLILIDGKFSTLPMVVDEGRRVTGNIERVANLFVTKTIYATFLSVIIGISGLPFMLLPRHITLVDAITIGTPAFFLSLAHTRKPYCSGFVKRVLKFAFPTGLMAGLAVLASSSLYYIFGYIDFYEMRTMATLTLVIVSFWGLVAIARPYNWWKIFLLLTMISGLIIVFAIPWLNNFFALAIPAWDIIFYTLGIGIFAIFILEILWFITDGRPKPAS